VVQRTGQGLTSTAATPKSISHLVLYTHYERNTTSRVTHRGNLHPAPVGRAISTIVLDYDLFLSPLLDSYPKFPNLGSNRFHCVNSLSYNDITRLNLNSYLISVGILPLQNTAIVAEYTVHVVSCQLHEAGRCVHDRIISGQSIRDAEGPLRRIDEG
jgi:hypothetical protein